MINNNSNNDINNNSKKSTTITSTTQQLEQHTIMNNTPYLNSVPVVLTAEVANVTFSLRRNVVQTPPPAQVRTQARSASTRARTSSGWHQPRRSTARRRIGWWRRRHYLISLQLFLSTVVCACHHSSGARQVPLLYFLFVSAARPTFHCKDLCLTKWQRYKSLLVISR